MIIFEFPTQSTDCTEHCLLIMNGHSNHVTANVIAFCMQNAIDLFIMLLHCLHLFQLLDVGVFALLKCALSKETDAFNQYNSSHISRIFWVEMYIKVCVKVLFSENLKARWKGAGLVPLDFDKIFDKLFKCTDLISNQSKTLPNEVNLDFLLLDSSPPDGTKLCEANKLFVFALDEIPSLSDSVRRYTVRLITMVEFRHAELITARKELKLVKEILNTRKKRTKGKRVALEGKFVFFTQEVLDIAWVVEVETETKKKHKQPRKRTIDEILDEEEAETLENESSSSDSDCIVVAKRT